MTSRNREGGGGGSGFCDTPSEKYRKMRDKGKEEERCKLPKELMNNILELISNL